MKLLEIRFLGIIRWIELGGGPDVQSCLVTTGSPYPNVALVLQKSDRFGSHLAIVPWNDNEIVLDFNVFILGFVASLPRSLHTARQEQGHTVLRRWAASGSPV